MRIFIMILVGFSLVYGENYWSCFRGNYRQDGLSSCIGPRKPVLVNTIKTEGGYGSAVITSDSTLCYYDESHHLYIVKDDKLVHTETFAEGYDENICADNEGMVYIPAGRVLYAYDPKLKIKRWRSDDGYYHISTKTFVGPDGILYLIDSYPYLNAYERTQGKRLWRYDIKKGGQTSWLDVAYGTDNGFYYNVYEELPGKLALYYIPDKFKYGNDFYPSYPSISKEGTIYSVSRSVLYAYNPGLELKWQVSLDDTTSRFMPCVIDKDDNIIAVSQNPKSSYLHKVSKEGKILWKTKEEDSDRFRYATVDAEGKIYVSVLLYDTYCFNSDGSLKYKIEGMSGFQCLIGPSRRLYLTGAFYSQTENNLLCFKDQEGFELNETALRKPVPSSLSAHPNPFKDRLNIETSSPGSIYDVTGRIVYRFNKGSSKIETSSWHTGVYIIKQANNIKRIVKVL